MFVRKKIYEAKALEGFGHVDESSNESKKREINRNNKIWCKK